VRARVLSADSPGAIAEAARILRAGGVVAFPTETVYGLGADAMNPGAVARVFEVKARPSFDPLIVHLADAEELPRVARTADPRASLLAARFWPGPLTLVLPRREELPELVTAGLDTVGVRVPAHAAARSLIREAIHETAEEGDVVIVSHGASMALAGREGVLRVLITASPETRAGRIAAAGLGERDAAKAVKESDAARADYFKRFYRLGCTSESFPSGDGNMES